MIEMSVTPTILTHGLVMTMDASGTSYPDGAVVLNGANIEAVGPSDEIMRRYDGRAANVVDAGGAIVMPGLIDGHAHPTNQLLAPGEKVRFGMTTVEYLSNIAYPLEKQLPASLAKIGAKLCFAEMLRNGVTCFNDGGGEQPGAIAQAAKEIGIRGTVTRSTRDYAPPGWPAEKMKMDTVPDAVAETEALIEEWHGSEDGRLRFWCQLRNPYSTSDAMASEIAKLARRKGVGIHGHLASNYGDRELSTSLFGKGVIERYDDLGVLESNFYAAHMNELNDADVKLVLERKLNIAHCPIAYIKLAMGLGTKIPELVASGLNFSIGTDGLTASQSADPFRIMFYFATCYNEVRREQNLISTATALKAGTIGGAKANMWDSEIGSLEAGKRADVIIVDHSGPEWGYINRDTVQSLVYACNGDKVRSVWVQGKQLMKDRQLLTADTKALVTEAKAGVNDLFKKVGLAPVH
jgi:cytosine/adenosine deaminase-related metal-dependent hydrolase